MYFKVTFIDNVKAVFITEFIETGIVRIMRSTDAVDIEFFHLCEVCHHIVHGDGITCRCTGIMTVDTFEFDGSTVDEKFTLVADGNASETDFFADIFTVCFDYKGI